MTVWLSWWRRPRGNAIDELDGHMMRDIGLPWDGVSARQADELLSRARDGDPWLL